MNDDNLNSIVIDDLVYETRLTKKYANRKIYQPVNHKKVIAFIPGLIQQVHVKVGDKVKRGDKLLVLEAMKMQNSVVAPIDGKVCVVPELGTLVKKNELLVEFD
jgi:biotin carboxyl carrier protein